MKGREDAGTPAPLHEQVQHCFGCESPHVENWAGTGLCSPSALLVDNVVIKWTRHTHTKTAAGFLKKALSNFSESWSDLVMALQVCACKDSNSKFGVCRPCLNSHFFSNVFPQDLFQFPPHLGLFRSYYLMLCVFLSFQLLRACFVWKTVIWKQFFWIEFTLKRPEMGRRTLQPRMNQSDFLLFDSWHRNRKCGYWKTLGRVVIRCQCLIKETRSSSVEQWVFHALLMEHQVDLI